ncbi:MAG: MtaA/CmuA family methyltransferase [Negativicutes bacterium]|nr:MtaA/CmuA family methyltransferase [Negativicutes bacterium]
MMNETGTEWMSPKRRFLSGLFGGRVDRPSAATLTSTATVELMKKTNCFFPDVHLNYEQMARLAATSYEVLGYDSIMPLFSTITESAALDVPTNWGHREGWPVHTAHPVTDPGEISLPKDFLERPSMDTALNAIKLLRREYGDHVAIIGKVFGPWSLAYHLVGTEPFLMDTILNPDKVRAYLEKLLPISLLSGQAQILAGADAILWCDHATGDLVSPACYRDFLLPIHSRVTKSRELGVPIALHICGNTTKMLPYIVQAGFDAFHFDSKVDARVGKEITGRKMTLAGGINNAVTLMTGSVDDVAAAARYVLEAGVEIASPECAIPLSTPTENLQIITSVAKEFGARA